jgi:hypothetical protein
MDYHNIDYYCILRTSGECLGYSETGEPQDDQQTQGGQQQAQDGEQVQQDQHHNHVADLMPRIDRNEFRRLAIMDLDGVCRFPTPDTTPTRPANLPYSPFDLVIRPTPLLWDTSAFPDDVWYNPVAQFPLQPTRKMSVFQAAFILNNLQSTDATILSRDRALFANAPSTDAEVQGVINEWRCTANEKIWSTAEIDIIRSVLEQGGSPVEAFFFLREKWLFYPKTYHGVYNKFMEVFIDSC